MADTLNLNVTDIADAVKIIDYAFEQGGFRNLNNIRQIIILRDRLEMFVVAANSSQQVNNPVPVLNEAATSVRKPPKRAKR